MLFTFELFSKITRRGSVHGYTVHFGIQGYRVVLHNFCPSVFDLRRPVEKDFTLYKIYYEYSLDHRLVRCSLLLRKFQIFFTFTERFKVKLFQRSYCFAVETFRSGREVSLEGKAALGVLTRVRTSRPGSVQRRTLGIDEEHQYSKFLPADVQRILYDFTI